MLLMWSALFLVIAIMLGIIAFSGIAIAISFFTKVLFFLSILCFMVSWVLIIVDRIQKQERKDEIDPLK